MSPRAVSPIGGQRPFIMRKGISKVGDLADGHIAMNAAMVGAKTVYYCEGNAGNDNNSGVGGWENAFKTLSVALAASHADISSNKYGWAARNVILCRADDFTEDLGLLAQKTDVIGVGSYNANAKPLLQGNHTPLASATGTRFFNFYFRGAATSGGDIFTLNSDNSNIEFHGCTFNANSTTAATAAIINTNSQFMGIFGCEFVGIYSDATIEFGAGAGLRGTKIIGNHIESAAVGIEMKSTALEGAAAAAGGDVERCYIEDNTIIATGLTIDDDSDGGAGVCYVSGNHLFSAATTTATAVDINLPTAGGNYLAFATVNSVYPYVDSSS